MSEPYSFDQPAYAGCYRNRQMCMDERHVYTIYDILCAWRFQHALELGSYDGASTTAFVEAGDRHLLDRFTACDVHHSDSLLRVLKLHAGLNKHAVIPSWDVLARPDVYDFILVDANHDMESVSKELEHIVRRVPLCVMAHDTNATAMGYPKAEGARHLRDTLRKHPAYRGKCIEDSVRRAGEETHRGLFFATTDQELYEKARDIFRNRCPVMEMQAA